MNHQEPFVNRILLHNSALVSRAPTPPSKVEIVVPPLNHWVLILLVVINPHQSLFQKLPDARIVQYARPVFIFTLKMDVVVEISDWLLRRLMNLVAIVALRGSAEPGGGDIRIMRLVLSYCKQDAGIIYR